MFEKEAEDFAERVCCEDCHAAPCEEKCECWVLAKKGVLFGYNKANEWHNIKENPNDLPNDGELVLANNIFTTECVKFKKEKDNNYWKHDNFELCDVVLWKEIVLPKEDKNDA